MPDISLPKSFTFVPSTAAGPLPFSVPCTTNAPAKLSSVTLAKNGSVTDATGKSKVAKGKSAKVTSVIIWASTRARRRPRARNWCAKMGKKTVDGTGKLNDAGNAVMKRAKVPEVGKHKISVQVPR